MFADEPGVMAARAHKRFPLFVTVFIIVWIVVQFHVVKEPAHLAVFELVKWDFSLAAAALGLSLSLRDIAEWGFKGLALAFAAGILRIAVLVICLLAAAASSSRSSKEASMRHSHTTDEEGFDFMDNSGEEEHDRDIGGHTACRALHRARGDLPARRTALAPTATLPEHPRRKHSFPVRRISGRTGHFRTFRQRRARQISRAILKEPS